MSETQSTFTLDFTDKTWNAVSFGKPWNGWATPVVTLETFEDIVAWAADTMTVNFHTNGTAMIEEPFGKETIYFEITPDANGNYDLSQLGWTFETA